MTENSEPCNQRMSDKMLDLVARRFRALGELNRLRILQVLTRGAIRVGDLVEEVDGNQSNISKHLKILYQAGIVGRRRDGNSIVYSLRDPTAFGLCELVHRNDTKRSSQR